MHSLYILRLNCTMKRTNEHLKESSEERKDKASTKILCPYCLSTFSRRDSLTRHLRNFHSSKQQQVTCDQCQKTFSSQNYLRRHQQKIHNTRTVDNRQSFQCRHCRQAFEQYRDLFDHVQQNHPLVQSGGRDVSTQNLNKTLSPGSTRKSDVQSANVVEVNENSNRMRNNQQENESSNDSALNKAVENHYIYPKVGEKYDLLVFLANVKDQVKKYLLSRSRASRGIKWNICVQVLMQRDDQEEKTSFPYFRSLTYRLLDEDTFDESDLNEAMQKIYARMEKYLREGSGWFVKHVIKLEVHTINYSPIHGPMFIPLPQTLFMSHSILNVYNNDDKCFVYCILASLHPTVDTPENVVHYTPYEHELDMSGIEYPVTLSQMSRFERQNSNISVNIFAMEDKEIVPLRITEHTERLHHVNLLLLQDGEKTHYCLISNLDRFLSRTNSRHNRAFFCPYCLHGFIRAELKSNHIPYCKINGPQKVELPAPGDNILQFKDFHKMLKTSFTIYCDFETLNRKIDTCPPNPNSTHTLQSHKLDVCGFGYKVVCEESAYTKPTVVYRGPDASNKLIECLLQESAIINDIMSHPKDMIMTTDDIEKAKEATTCCFCNKKFSLYDDTYN